MQFRVSFRNNDRAGGHAGGRSAERLLDGLRPLGLSVVCAGGIGNERDFARVLAMGYAGAQLGTRFIATEECRAGEAYKRGIVEAGENDIVLTERLTSVPVAVIDTPSVRRLGPKAGPLARWMLRGRRTKRWMRSLYALRSLWAHKMRSLLTLTLLMLTLVRSVLVSILAVTGLWHVSNLLFDFAGLPDLAYLEMVRLDLTARRGGEAPPERLASLLAAAGGRARPAPGNRVLVRWRAGDAEGRLAEALELLAALGPARGDAA